MEATKNKNLTSKNGLDSLGLYFKLVVQSCVGRKLMVEVVPPSMA